MLVLAEPVFPFHPFVPIFWLALFCFRLGTLEGY